MKRTLSALAAAALWAGAGTTAGAQIWLGQMSGQMAADQANVQLEFNCRHAIPLDAERAKANLERVQKAMTAYRGLTSSATQKDLAAVFESEGPETRWQDGEQKATLTDLASHLVPLAEAPKLTVAVMSGDGATARTIWSGQDANGPVFYAVDFTAGTWLRDARIIDMVISHGAAPETPPAYCHLSESFVGS